MSDDKAAVFVIDDDESIREALRSLLATVGLEVHTFQSTREFLDAKRPDLPACLVRAALRPVRIREAAIPEGG